MTNPITVVQNFSPLVSCGRQPQTMRMTVTNVDHIDDLRRAANSDVFDGAAIAVQRYPDLDSGQGCSPTGRAQRGWVLMRDQLRRLYELAGSPTMDQLKDYSDRAGHSVSRSALAAVTVDSDSALRWGDLDLADRLYGEVRRSRYPLQRSLGLLGAGLAAVERAADLTPLREAADQARRIGARLVVGHAEAALALPDGAVPDEVFFC